MRNTDGMVADARKALEHEWMRARQPMYQPRQPVIRPRCPTCGFKHSGACGKPEGA